MKTLKKTLVFALLLLVMSFTALAKVHTEDLFPGEQITYTLDEYEDSAKYTVFIEEDGIFSLKIVSMTSRSGYQPRITVSLKDKGKVLSQFTTNINTLVPENYFMYEGMYEGEYTVEIRNETKFGDAQYVIDTFFTPWDNVEKQGAYSHENATEMTLSRRYKGGIMQCEDKEYFTFTMPKDGYAVIDLYSSDVKYFTLYDDKLNVIGEMHVRIDEPDTMFETRCGLSAGKYYISVTPEESYVSPEYALEVRAYHDAEFEAEYNNTPSYATELGTGKELRGNLYGYDDEDVYSFTVDKKSKVTATITDLYLTNDGHYNFSILDSDGKVMVTREKCNTYSLTQTLDKGTYYLAVSCPAEGYYTSFGYKVKVKTLALSEEKTEAKDEEKAQDTDVEKKEENSLPQVQFDDVSNDAWYAQDVLTARSKNLLDGMGENKFVPMGTVTVAQAVTMAARMYEKFSGAEINVPVSPDGAWYNSYVIYAIAAGIIGEREFDSFDRPASRKEMAYIFCGVLKNVDAPDVKVMVPDVKEQDKYAQEVYKLYRLGILTGVDEKGTFNPNSDITRAESAVIMLRVANFLGI